MAPVKPMTTTSTSSLIGYGAKRKAKGAKLVTTKRPKRMGLKRRGK